MTNPIEKKSKRNFYFVTGPRGIGKTWFAVTACRPSELGGVYIHDDEGSNNHTLAELERQGYKIGHYVDLEKRFDLPDQEDMADMIASGNLPWVNSKERAALASYYKWVVNDISENLTPGKYHTYILDTIGTFEAAMAAYVRTNKQETGWKTDSYGRMWTEAYFPLYQHFLSSIWDRGVDTIIFCAHLKNVWQDNRPVPGKTTMIGKKVLQFWSSLSLWLVAGDDPQGAPAGLVLKERMGQMGINAETDEWELRRMLPHRLPSATWSAIRRYLKEGCDLMHPAPGEAMSRAEADMISPLMNDKQLELMILQAQRDLDQDSGGSSFAPVIESPEKALEISELAEKIKVLRLEKEDEEIRAMLRAEGHKVPTVMKAFKSLRS